MRSILGRSRVTQRVRRGGRLCVRSAAALHPSGEAAFEERGFAPLLVQRFRDVLADFVAVHAEDDDRLRRRQLRRPARNALGIAAQRAAERLRVFEKSFAAPDVDHQRRRFAAESLRKLRYADTGHVSLLEGSPSSALATAR